MHAINNIKRPLNYNSRKYIHFKVLNNNIDRSGIEYIKRIQTTAKNPLFKLSTRESILRDLTVNSTDIWVVNLPINEPFFRMESTNYLNEPDIVNIIELNTKYDLMDNNTFLLMDRLFIGKSIPYERVIMDNLITIFLHNKNTHGLLWLHTLIMEFDKQQFTDLNLNGPTFGPKIIEPDMIDKMIKLSKKENSDIAYLISVFKQMNKTDNYIQTVLERMFP